MIYAKSQKLALSRTIRKVLKKAKLPERFISQCSIRDYRRDYWVIGSSTGWLPSTVESLTLTKKGANRFLNIIPCLIKKLNKTKIACKCNAPLRFCEQIEEYLVKSIEI